MRFDDISNRVIGCAVIEAIDEAQLLTFTFGKTVTYGPSTPKLARGPLWFRWCFRSQAYRHGGERSPETSRNARFPTSQLCRVRPIGSNFQDMLET